MEIFASYTGTDFLIFYCVMLATCVLAGLWIPANLRPEGRPGQVEDMEEVAVLAGGAERHTSAVLSALFARGGLAEGDKKKLRVSRKDVGESEAERTVLSKPDDFRLSEIRPALRSQAKAIERRLIERGLITVPHERWKLRLLSVLPYAVLIAIGIYRHEAGEALGEPTGILFVLLWITFVMAVVRVFRFNNRTMAGNEVLRDLEEQSSRMKRAPQATEAGFAVAIFGTAVLVGTPWEPVHAARQASGGDGGTGGDGDGGGCGGGCGGCGG